MTDIKNDIKYMIDNIDSEEKLLKIAEVCKDAMPITLRQYIDNELGCAPDEVKDKFECEVNDFYSKAMKSDIRVDKNPCNDWCDLWIDCLQLDDWIGGDYPVFNPLRLAICVYKLWANEIRL